MNGETVKLVCRQAAGRDPFNNEVFEECETEVENVLVQPAGTQDDTDSNRPEGIKAKYLLLFPKAFAYGSGSLRGTKIEVRGKRYKVIGDPGCYDGKNCPTDWCMPVHVGDIDG